MKNILLTVLILFSIQIQAQTFYTETIIGSRQYLGQANQAILEVKFANNNSSYQILKPLIVVEGFDSGLLGTENELGENDLQDFIDEATIFTGNLSNEINTYDIIYINFKNGKDYMQRNAYLVQDIIKWVNSVKQGTQPNVVLGQSMGGVLARYALRDMENQLASSGNQTWNHQTNLYISHDAPHQGANIPVGIQYFARHLANQFIDTPVGDYQIELDGGNNISIADIQNLLNAQGTKQLLANYINSSFAIDNSAFNTFQTELRNLGYPQQTRNVALSNGNHCANPQSFNPGANLFTLNGNASTTALTTFLTALIEPITGISAPILAFEFNEPGLLLGMLPGSSSFAMNFKANALPTAGSTIQVYHGSISYTKKIFSLFGWNPKITVSLTSRSHNNPALLSYDYYPGGKYQLPFNFSTSTINNDFINLGISAYLAPSFNFIPTPSALDVGNGNVVLNNNDYFVKYNSSSPPTGSRAIPFVNFLTSHNTTGINEKHISFNTRNGNWLASELDEIPNNQQFFNCSFFCENIEINGAERFCSGVRSYGLPSGGSAYQWQIIEGNAATITAGATSRVVTITKTNFNGWITLEGIVFSTECGDSETNHIQVSTTKRIYIGVPTLNFLENVNLTETGLSQPIAPISSCSDIGLKLNLWPSNPEVLEVQWEKVTTNFQWSHTNTEYVIITPVCNEPVTFRVRFRNSCGWSPWQDITYNVTECSGSCSNPQGNITSTDFIIFPVPADTSLTVKLKNQPVGLLVAGDTLNIKLYNISGLMVRNVNAIATQTVIDVSNLNMGTYTLVITYNGVVETHNVAIN